MQLSIAEIVLATKGKLNGLQPDLVVKSICTDTRLLKPGDFYVALKGPNFDGHDFIGEARAKGAIGAMVSRKILEKGDFALVQVPDTLKALGDIAHCWRKKFSIPIVAVTGSSGKTTTKDILALCLNQKWKVHKTEGNLNNLIGLPLTLLSMDISHEVAILEMGMNAFGEIARLTEIARPTLGLITNVGAAHLEGVGSVKGVAKAKAELFNGMESTSTVIVNADDPYILKMATNAKKITYGFSSSAQIRGLEMKTEKNQTKLTLEDPAGKKVFVLPFVGKPFMTNWLATWAICFKLGLPAQMAQEGVAQFKATRMRGEELVLENGVVVINDCYNANPDSVKASLAVLDEKYSSRRKIVVLGEMLELGDEASDWHKKIGEEIAKHQISHFIAIGDHAKYMAEGYGSGPGCAHVFDDMEKLQACLAKILKPEDVVLIKGSRGMCMERAVEFIKGMI